ncbi:MAG: FKBP-type peptidyl-prolyl cis-trans isomerase [Candidatus Kapabacteria bacterium]|nr:FKBP-type peptidyl-prolyl cis-trans isomerase [Candidatus Kapabacteria bacterium]
MKFLMKTLVFGFFMFAVYACGEQNERPQATEPKDLNLPKPDSLVDQFSYVQGYEFGFFQSFDSVVLNFDYFMQGYWDAFNKKDAMFNQDSLEFIKQSWMQRIQEQRDAKLEVTRKKMEEVGKEVLERDQKFMMDIRQKEGMITRPSGLVYKIIQQGKGPVPTNDDFIKMHFVQKLTDGKIIDSTYKGNPFDLPVQAVYPGWNEALRMMPVGSIWELYVPPHLAFRDMGLGDIIPPHSAIILRIELISILEGEELQKAVHHFMQIISAEWRSTRWSRRTRWSSIRVVLLPGGMR